MDAREPGTWVSALMEECGLSVDPCRLGAQFEEPRPAPRAPSGLRPNSSCSFGFELGLSFVSDSLVAGREARRLGGPMKPETACVAEKSQRSVPESKRGKQL
jgi:hypothetical protein